MESGVLLTGGLGFIGSTLLEKLLAKTNNTIYLMDDKGIERLPDLRLDSLISNPRVVIMPESEIFNLSHSLLNSGIESIIHLGAIASTAKDVSRFELFSKNVFFTEKLFRFANLSNSRVIYASSMAVYGNSNSD